MSTILQVCILVFIWEDILQQDGYIIFYKSQLAFVKYHFCNSNDNKRQGTIKLYIIELGLWLGGSPYHFLSPQVNYIRSHHL